MGRQDGRTLADEWFDDFIHRINHHRNRARVLSDGVPRVADRHLSREREYDAQTERLRRVIRENRPRQERRHA